MTRRRRILVAFLALCSPCVLLLVALPVGFVMEIGKQATITVENRTDRPLRVTPIAADRNDSHHRVAPRTLHPLLPLPAFRTSELPLAPGEQLRIVYSARQALPCALAVREADGRIGTLHGEGIRPLFVITGPPLGAETWPERVIEADSPLFRWAVLLAGPLGSLAFLAALRAYRRAPAGPGIP